MKVAIYGAGSLGTVLGAYITKAGVDIDLINRNKAHVAALNANGAKIVGTVDFTTKVKAMLPDQMADKYDIIFLMTKVIDNKSVVLKLKDHLTDAGVICTMQNGIPELLISDIIGGDRTFGCAIGWGAEMLDGGVCKLTSEPDALHFSLGNLKNLKGKMFDEIVRLLSLMGQVDIEENFIGARWSKLLVNSAFSGLSAVLGCTFGEIADNKTSRLYAQRVIKECIDVSSADNVKIEPIQGKDVAKLMNYNSAIKRKIAFALIPLAIKKHRSITASMLQDLKKSKPCEIDAINGVVCDYGKKVGVPTPVNDRIVKIVKDMEKGIGSPSWENLTLFEDLK